MFPEAERIRGLLLDLGAHVRGRLDRSRRESSDQHLSQVARESVADTIYEIDRVSEEAIVNWFQRYWPAEIPVELVMEGIDEPVTFPNGTGVDETICKCILDPIDGTRGIMYDKRSAWFLAGIAPQLGASTTLADLEIAAMVELPTSKQWRSDVISGVRGHGVKAESYHMLTGETKPLTLQPSRAGDVLHGFACISRFFPTGKTLTASIEEQLWAELGYTSPGRESLIFEDQYICSGGQFYEILTGHDRMLADLRPLVFRALGIRSALCCHPYDVCTALILSEMGVVVEQPSGKPLDAPLDTVSPVSWVGYANPVLAKRIRPVLQRVLEAKLNE